MTPVKTHTAFVIKSEATNSSLSLFFAKQKATTQITNVNKAWIPVNIRNPMKYLIFLYPTQVPTHGQWWSWTSTHNPQVLQWKDLGGLNILQVLQ